MYEFFHLDLPNQHHLRIHKVLSFHFRFSNSKATTVTKLIIAVNTKCINLYNVFTNEMITYFQFDKFEISPFFLSFQKLTKYFRSIFFHHCLHTRPLFEFVTKR